MPALTRRRDPEAHQEVWHGDVRVGTIGGRAGVPVDVDQWGWSCGFYPMAGPYRADSGTAPNFKKARRYFNAAWKALLPTLTEADFEAWRRQRDWTARKYAMWARGEKLPSQIPSSRMRCVCGVTFNSHQPTESYPTAATSMSRKPTTVSADEIR
jgi:hypothetical protein